MRINKIKIQNEETNRVNQSRQLAHQQTHKKNAQRKLSSDAQTAAFGSTGTRPRSCATTAAQSHATHTIN